MINKQVIQTSPLTNRIHMGRVNKEGNAFTNRIKGG